MDFQRWGRVRHPTRWSPLLSFLYLYWSTQVPEKYRSNQVPEKKNNPDTRDIWNSNVLDEEERTAFIQYGDLISSKRLPDEGRYFYGLWLVVEISVHIFFPLDCGWKKNWAELWWKTVAEVGDLWMAMWARRVICHSLSLSARDTKTRWYLIFFRKLPNTRSTQYVSSKKNTFRVRSGLRLTDRKSKHSPLCLRLLLKLTLEMRCNRFRYFWTWIW